MTIRECIGCRVEKEVDTDSICPDCREWEKKHLEELRLQADSFFKCTKCDYEGVATDLHHIHGRKNSNITVRLCCNCHAEIHRGGAV